MPVQINTTELYTYKIIKMVKIMLSQSYLKLEKNNPLWHH